jgi:hypothetical protein
LHKFLRMKKYKSLLIWIFAIVFTLTIAVYQKMTGPTYPVKGTITLNKKEIKYRLPRTSDSETGEKIKVEVADATVKGEFTYKRFKSNDTLTTVAMTREGEYLTAIVPPQPSAGKVQYKITLESGTDKAVLSNDWVVLRYKGAVPLFILIPHVILMFLAMLFSSRTGLEALFKGFSTYRYSFVTLVALFLGGAILGPIVQKYAFGAYWTGWPFGHDLTDNKTLVALIFWGIAFFKLSKNKYDRKWAIIAAVVLLAVYLVPHSVLGSEIDYTQVK